MIKGGEGWDDYVDRIGLFFFFVACAGISLIVFAFNLTNEEEVNLIY